MADLGRRRRYPSEHERYRPGTVCTLNTDKDYRRALASLRSAAENKFVSELQPALSQYMQDHNGQFPSDLNLLQTYFTAPVAPVNPAILERWGIVPAKSLKSLGMGGDWIITQKSAPDGEFDSRWGVGPFGFGKAGQFDEKPSPVDTLTPALKQYFAANSGQPPAEPALLLPYLNTDEQRAELDKIIQRFKLMSESDRARMWQEAQSLVGAQPVEPK